MNRISTEKLNELSTLTDIVSRPKLEANVVSTINKVILKIAENILEDCNSNNLTGKNK